MVGDERFCVQPYLLFTPEIPQWERKCRLCDLSRKAPSQENMFKHVAFSKAGSIQEKNLSRVYSSSEEGLRASFNAAILCCLPTRQEVANGPPSSVGRPFPQAVYLL